MNETLTKSIELAKAQLTNAEKTLAFISEQLNADAPPLAVPPFGENIKALHLRHNLTQLDLCAALNINQYALSGYERDIITPDVETVLKMAKYFNVTVDELINGKEAK